MSDSLNLEPLQREGVMDYHVHCDYSVDAEGSIDEFCEAALQRNLAEICFTTHYDINPKLKGTRTGISVNGIIKPVSPENLTPYVDDVRAAAEKFYPRGLSVKLGVEFGWFEGCEEAVQDLESRHHFDYMLGGIHELDNVCIACRSSYEEAFAKYSVEEMVEKYYRQAVNAARSGLFDTIAHLDYYVKYGRLVYGDIVDTAYQPYIDELFTALKDSQRTGMEINTAGMRHGRQAYYPSMEIINLAKKAGVEVRMLGSDAHRPEQVGYDFELAVQLVPDTLTGCED